MWWIPQKLFKTECPTDLLINYVEIRNLTSIHNVEGSSPLSLIVDRFWHLWWKYGAIRERGITLNFSPSLLSSWWCQRQCFLRCWHLCPMPGSQSCAIGPENINQSPNLACAHCLPITRYKPTNNRKKTLSIFNEIGLIVISIFTFIVSSRVLSCLKTNGI